MKHCARVFMEVTSSPVIHRNLEKLAILSQSARAQVRQPGFKRGSKEEGGVQTKMLHVSPAKSEYITAYDWQMARKRMEWHLKLLTGYPSVKE